MTFPLPRRGGVRLLVAAFCLLAGPLAAQSDYVPEDDPSIAPFLDSLEEAATARDLTRERRYAEALPLLNTLAETDNPWALNLLGTLYTDPDDGVLVPDDYAIGHAYYERAAALDFPPALYNLGVDYADGFVGQDPDIGRAVTYFERAVALNYEAAMARLANIMINGADPEFIDAERGRALIDAAIAIDPDTAYNRSVLADTFYWGAGRPQDYGRALELYEGLAAEGDSYGQTRAGIQHLYGEGTAVDAVRARDYLEAAVAQDYSHALGYLAEIYFYEYDGIEMDDPRAYDLARRAVEAGEDWPGYIMGYVLLYGADGIDIDYDAARATLTRAAADGHPDARAELASMAYFGWGGPIDYPAAYRLLTETLAENPDHVYSRYAAAVMQMRGHGTERDIATALATLQDIYDAGGYYTTEAEAGLAVILGHPDYVGDWSDPVRAYAYCIDLGDEVIADPEEDDFANDRLPETCTGIEETLTEVEKAAARTLAETL